MAKTPKPRATRNSQGLRASSTKPEGEPATPLPHPSFATPLPPHQPTTSLSPIAPYAPLRRSRRIAKSPALEILASPARVTKNRKTTAGKTGRTKVGPSQFNSPKLAFDVDTGLTTFTPPKILSPNRLPFDVATGLTTFTPPKPLPPLPSSEVATGLTIVQPLKVGSPRVSVTIATEVATSTPPTVTIACSAIACPAIASPAIASPLIASASPAIQQLIQSSSPAFTIALPSTPQSGQSSPLSTRRISLEYWSRSPATQYSFQRRRISYAVGQQEACLGIESLDISDDNDDDASDIDVGSLSISENSDDTAHEHHTPSPRDDSTWSPATPAQYEHIKHTQELAHETAQFKALKNEEVHAERLGAKLYKAIERDHERRGCECGLPRIYETHEEAEVGQGTLRFYRKKEEPNEDRFYVFMRKEDKRFHCRCNAEYLSDFARWVRKHNVLEQQQEKKASRSRKRKADEDLQEDILRYNPGHGIARLVEPVEQRSTRWRRVDRYRVGHPIPIYTCLRLSTYLEWHADIVNH